MTGTSRVAIIAYEHYARTEVERGVLAHFPANRTKLHGFHASGGSFDPDEPSRLTELLGEVRLAVVVMTGHFAQEMAALKAAWRRSVSVGVIVKVKTRFELEALSAIHMCHGFNFVIGLGERGSIVSLFPNPCHGEPYFQLLEVPDIERSGEEIAALIRSEADRLHLTHEYTGGSVRPYASNPC